MLGIFKPRRKNILELKVDDQTAIVAIEGE